MANAFYALSGNNLLSFDHLNPSAVATTAITGRDRRRNAGRHRFPPAERLAVWPRRQCRRQHRDALSHLDTHRLCDSSVGTARTDRLHDRRRHPGRSAGSRDRRLELRLQSGRRPHSRHRRHRPELPHQSEHRHGGRRRRRRRHTGTNPDGAINGGRPPSTAPPTPTTSRTASLRRCTRWMRVRTPCSSRIRRMPARRRSATTVTLNGSPLDFTSVNGFDIPAGVNAAAPIPRWRQARHLRC